MRKREDDFLTPDLTPLIDVVFILLIFFLVSSVFKKQELALLLKLPSSKQAETFSVHNKDLTIELRGEQMAVNGKNMELAQLDHFLKGVDRKKTVHLRADQKTLYQQVIKVLDLLKNNRLNKINLITEVKNP